MNIEIITTGFTLDMFGFSAVAMSKDYAGTAFKLMDKMWQVVKSNELKNKGINIWVYEQDEKVFAGVELDKIPGQHTGLEQKNISLVKYAYYKHVGSYKLLKQSGNEMREQLLGKDFETCFPYIEMYGHWTNDESKLETEIIMCLK